MGKNGVSKRLAKIESTLKKDKPEVKTLDILLNPLTGGPNGGTQGVYAGGILSGAALVNYDLTRGFIQGLENEGGNIDGNYCKLTSMDMRILLQNPSAVANLAGANPTPYTNQVRLMIIRLPNASPLTPAEVQTQVLEYGVPATYGALCNVSPLKRNSTINGGYDVMYDKTHIANANEGQAKSSKMIHFRKKWSKGLTLRFSGVAGALALEQNRILLFAMDATNVYDPAAATPRVNISFINRLRYSDE